MKLSSSEFLENTEGGFQLADLNKSTPVIKKQKEAKQLKLFSDPIHHAVEKETSKQLAVPDVDHEKRDSWSILGVVLEVSVDGVYQIRTRNKIRK